MEPVASPSLFRSCSSVPVFRSHIISEVLRLLISMMRVVGVVGWSDVIVLVNAATFIASLERPFARDLRDKCQCNTC